jgi:AmmeMemoRadiSam system protein B
MSNQLLDTRPSPLAGKWYPSSADQLADSIDNFITQAKVTPISGRIVGILAPHAGHRYSGPVAGHAYQLIKGMEVDTVALIGPSHYPYSAPIITTAHEAYATPLGKVMVAHDLLDQINQLIPLEAVRRDPEHSLEIELPFLQRTLGGNFRLIPLALVDQSLEMAEHLGHALGKLLKGQKALLVASSDLSHFYSETIANQLDQTILDAVGAFNPTEVINAEKEGEGFACGRGAIAAVMIAAHDLGATSAQVLNYATSGAITGDFRQVVGYGAAVFYA